MKDGEELVMPSLVKDYCAGIDWAGNSGKLIANLLFKEDTIGEKYTIYSGHGLTWGEIADIYREITGVKIRWCSEEEFLRFNPKITQNLSLSWCWKYDRRFNRDIDASKVLKATGLSSKDFATVSEGIQHELNILNWKK